MPFLILAIIIVINVGMYSRSWREALLYGLIAGILLGVITGGAAGYLLADQWRMPRPRAVLIGAGIETLWKAPLLFVLCAISYALRGNKPQADA